MDRLERQLEETRKSLRSTCHALNRHLKVNSKLVRQAEAFHDFFADFADTCRRELGISPTRAGE